jgi:hypothetical protein
MGQTTEMFNTTGCTTRTDARTGVYWCRADVSTQRQCRYKMSFGCSFLCLHLNRDEFVERAHLDEPISTSAPPAAPRGMTDHGPTTIQ